MNQSTLFYIIDFFVILAACMVAEWTMDRIREWRDRDLDINCDNCDKPKKLARTPDKNRYLCEECMPAYITEHFPDMDPSAFKRAYRRRKLKRGKK